MASFSKTNPVFDTDDEASLDEKPPLVTQPSRRIGSRNYSFDKRSQERINNLPQTHKRVERLKTAIDETAEYVARGAEKKRQQFRGGMTYERFMEGLLYADEGRLLDDRFFHYTKIMFSYEDKKVKNMKREMKKGRAVLTNHRIIFLSNTEIQENAFSGVTREKPEWRSRKERKKELLKEPTLIGVTDDLETVDLTKIQKALRLDIHHYTIDPDLPKSKRYAVVGRAQDLVSYFSIPLGCIKHVEFDADMEATSLSIMKRKKPCCCCRLFGCCGCNPCVKQWNEEWTADGDKNSRVVVLGVHLPPWGHKCLVHIYVSPEQKIEIVRDLVVDLQHYAPDLYTGKMVYRG